MTDQPADRPIPLPETVVTDDGAARVSWPPEFLERGFTAAVALLTAAVNDALDDHERVEALVPAADDAALRLATWAGLRREGVRRGVDGDFVVLARLVTDPPVSEPDGFRSLLNSFLPRKRAIGQMLVRDPDDRVLMCQLTYKPDWDLPGGVVEVDESPRLAVSRELQEELGVTVDAGALVLTDWLPPWRGWDDAVCLVFDGGIHEPALVEQIVREEREIRSAEFCTLDTVRERAADFTARRVEAALANLTGGMSRGYTESGRAGPE